MTNEQNKYFTTDSEKVEATENELILLQIDKWLQICLDDMFSNLMEDDLTETDELEEPLGEKATTTAEAGKEVE